MTTTHSPNLPHLLVVDDDNRLRQLLRKYLTDQGFVVVSAKDAGEAREKLKFFSFDLAILDIMMPGETGLELARSFSSPIPVLFLTALGEQDDRIAGLEAGADDYLVKPFEPRELLLRIQAILRRCASFDQTIKIGDWVFYPDQNLLKKGQEHIGLNTTETQILQTMAASPGEAFSRETLAEQYAVNVRTVDVWMTRLRRKIESDPRNPRYLLTIRHKGYVLWLS